MKADPAISHSWGGELPAPPMLIAESPEAVQPDAAEAPLDPADVFARHGDFVWRSLQRLGVREADLEDVAQDVFVVVGRQLRGFEGHSKLTTWLYGICVRVASTHRRRAWVRREVPTSDPLEGPDPAGGPDEALDAARLRRRLLEVLDRMDVAQRALLVMFEIDEMPCEEIAAVLGVPTGTVYSRLHAARKEFQAAMKRHQARSRPTVLGRWFGRTS
jgi:RNA polymerase sigma-70 factor (ECF subfamily)